MPGLGRFPGEEKGSPLQNFCLENPHGQRSLVGFSPWDCKELDTTEQLTHTFSWMTGSSEMGQESQELPPPSTMQSLSPRDRVSAAAGCGARRASDTSTADVAPAQGLSAVPHRAWAAFPDRRQRGSSVAGHGQKGPRKAGTRSLVVRSGSVPLSFAPQLPPPSPHTALHLSCCSGQDPWGQPSPLSSPPTWVSSANHLGSSLQIQPECPPLPRLPQLLRTVPTSHLVLAAPPTWSTTSSASPPSPSSVGRHAADSHVGTDHPPPTTALGAVPCLLPLLLRASPGSPVCLLKRGAPSLQGNGELPHFLQILAPRSPAQGTCLEHPTQNHTAAPPPHRSTPHGSAIWSTSISGLASHPGHPLLSRPAWGPAGRAWFLPLT